jgi:vancomycin resistance protein YoaR
MTTRTQEIQLALAPAGGFPWRRLAFAFLLTLLAIVLFAATFALGYSRLHDGRVLPGIDVAGISLAGLDRRGAEVKLREELPALSSGQLTVSLGDTSQSIPYSAIERDYDMQLMLDQAFAVGHDGSLFDQVQEQLRILLRGVSVEPSMTWNSERLAERVAAVAATGEVAPTDAIIERPEGRYAVVPASEGQTVDVEHGVGQAIAAVNNLSAADTAITLRTAPVPPAITTDQAQAAVDRVERVTATGVTVSGGGESATVSADELRGWVRLDEVAAGNWEVVIEREPAAQVVALLAQTVDQPAQDATWKFKDGAAVVVAAQDGRAVDVESTTNSLMSALEGRLDGGGSPTVNLAIAPVKPGFSTAEAQQIVSRVELLAKWTTNFVPSGPYNGNGVNIAIPTSIINGTVLEPGERFDFWKIVGEVTPEKGYTNGAAIRNGRTKLGEVIGGGMCSCSTTIFNAALRSGLEMGARKNHYYYITRYPVGLDATVWYSSPRSNQNMRFTNDMQYPILIRGINKYGKVTFQVWGVPDGRTVSFSRPAISNRRPAYSVKKYTDSLSPGKTKWVEYPVNGFDVTVVRTVRDANGTVLHRDPYFSHYAMIKGIMLIGRSDGDPRAGTEVRF